MTVWHRFHQKSSGKLLALDFLEGVNQRFFKKTRFLGNSRRSGRETHFMQKNVIFAHFFCTFCTFRRKFSIIGNFSMKNGLDFRVGPKRPTRTRTKTANQR